MYISSLSSLYFTFLAQSSFHRLFAAALYAVLQIQEYYIRFVPQMQDFVKKRSLPNQPPHTPPQKSSQYGLTEKQNI
jgi:hypothetical protein